MSREELHISVECRRKHHVFRACYRECLSLLSVTVMSHVLTVKQSFYVFFLKNTDQQLIGNEESTPVIIMSSL